MSEFQKTVKSIVSNIPKGKVMTYKEVAVAAGSPKAYRAVASIMANNYEPTIPCHRVIRSDGRAGDYNRGGEEQKRAILLSEGVKI